MIKNLMMLQRILLTGLMIGSVYAKTDWNGFYAGINTGFSFDTIKLNSQQLGFTNLSATCNQKMDVSNSFLGFQLGYLNHALNNFVSGIETTVSVNTDQETDLICQSDINPSVYDRFMFKNQLHIAIKGRFGPAWHWNQNQLLPYLTVGANFAKVTLTYQNEGGDYYRHHAFQPGLLLGLGLEWAFQKHWSLRFEYNYVDYPNGFNLTLPSVYGLIDPNGHANFNLTENTLFIALNYWLN